MSDCHFCHVVANDRAQVVAENEHAYVVRDNFPVTPGHTLLLPKRHVADYFGLNEQETLAIHALLCEQKRILEEGDATIEGFNVGVNCGEMAGQSFFHCHVHLIPRRRGDVDKPKGGVRHVVPKKGFY